MLEAKLDTHILTQSLIYPTDSAIVKASKQDILRSDYERLLSVSSTHPSGKHVATVAQSTSWSRLGHGTGSWYSGHMGSTVTAENTHL